MLETIDEQRPVVLVVDDAPSSLGMLCDTLEGEGYTVLVARDGDSALQRLELVAPDAILLDAVMPGLSGFDTCRQIKANPVMAHIPVIFMTGLSETQHVLEGFACGGVDYVVKPLRAQEVVARLHTHTRNARMTRLAREAVDVAGFGVVLVDARGRVAWRSPQAALWLQGADVGAQPGRLPEPVYAALDARGRVAWRSPQAALWLQGADVGAQPGRLPEPVYAALEGDSGEVLLSLAGVQLSVRNMGRVGIGETMLLLEQRSANAASPSRLANAALTPRETEVLSWLAKGKTNRDIGDILGMSHRTVNKHLEHIFEKLGVETRAAAAALATGHVF